MKILFWAGLTAVNVATPLAVVSCTRVRPAPCAACVAVALAAVAAVWALWAGPIDSLQLTRIFGSGEKALAFIFAPWLATVLAAGMILAFPGWASRAPPRSAQRALDGRAGQIGHVSLCVLALLGVVYAFWSELDEAACWISLVTLQSAGLAWLSAGRRVASPPSA